MQNNIRKIDEILLKNGYTREYLKECETNGLCNGLGPKGGINFSKLFRKLKFFQSGKEKQLLDDADLVADIHDLSFTKGGDYFDFLRANYIFARDLAGLLSWTTKYGRATIFLLAFFGTTLFGRKYFNFK